jgi:predicted MFS family arabinose efflux permease
VPCATGGTAIEGEAGRPSPEAGALRERPGRPTFREVFGLAEFRALWLAQLLSVAGDQLARVALTLLVFGRTGSSLLAAVAFAASVIPTALGGVALAGIADRLPRRTVMITCDVARAALVVVMTLPGVPIWALVGLLFLVTLISAPFTSARAALYPDILAGERYPVGTAVTLTTLQIAQVIGFAAAGVVVGLFGVRTCLLVDALTFACSAVIIRIWVRARPAARESARQDGAAPVSLRASLGLAFADPALRFPMLLAWLVAVIDVPEGVSAPLAASLGGGAVAVGMILAAGALGSSAGAVAVGRFVSPAARLRWMAPLAAASCAMLSLFALQPALPAVLAILTVSGVFSCYLVAANAAFVAAAPPQVRSQAFGVAQAGMSLGQGLAMIAAGAATEHHSPSAVIAVFGAAGALLAVAMAAAGPGGSGARSAWSGH